MGDAASRVLGQVHQNALRMRRNRLPVNGNHATHVDGFPDLTLQSRANADTFIEHVHPRAQSMVLLQRVPVTVEPDENVKMGVPRRLKLQYPVIVSKAMPFHVTQPRLEPTVEHRRRHIRHLL